MRLLTGTDPGRRKSTSGGPFSPDLSTSANGIQRKTFPKQYLAAHRISGGSHVRLHERVGLDGDPDAVRIVAWSGVRPHRMRSQLAQALDAERLLIEPGSVIVRAMLQTDQQGMMAEETDRLLVLVVRFF
jgi:hypothetical protein